MTAQNKVMKLWTAIVTAFLALCTALGLVSATTTTAAAAAPRTETPSTDTGTAHRTIPTIPAMRHRPWSHARALPPTMKQRIRAEAHGKTPGCRHRPLDGTQTESQPWVPEQTDARSHDQHLSDSLDC
ncbi:MULTISPECIES: DUF6344 domain-containing protein [unclassified Streptomyces]|uniref:DUF6344 domain-containing protein n=1 Tax=unclassified Streptomyces TaxID=2593676 RepID=UPI00104E2B6B